jgi:6-pyruvoyltetrahydropterin/6-carboxytetrahydropterin synthase
MEIVIEGLHFSAAHRLVHHPGKCSHLHGHNFGTKMTFYGEHIDDETGMLVDFGEVKQVVNECVDSLDHCSILNVEDKGLVEFLRKMENRVVIMGNEPTAEEISKFLFHKTEERIDSNPKFHKRVVLVEVQIWETPKFSAKYGLEDRGI